MPVIDNETKPLLGELQKFLPHAEKASIAVGYFFISGFAEIMDSLKRIEGSDNPDHVLRLLISPVTDRRTAEAILSANGSYEDAKAESGRDMPETKATESAQGEVAKALEYMTQTDKEYAAVRKIIHLIRGGKMQVKVYTQAQLHAKAYIFELDAGQLTRGVAHDVHGDAPDTLQPCRDAHRTGNEAVRGGRRPVRRSRQVARHNRLRRGLQLRQGGPRRNKTSRRDLPRRAGFQVVPLFRY